jgi:proline dehydrogenase
VIDRIVVRFLPRPPRAVVRRFARQYSAGPSLEDGCRLAASLNARGLPVALGLLGEDAHEPAETRAYAGAYRQALVAIADRGLDATLSVKLSALGLGFDEELCFEQLLSIVENAAGEGSAVFVDMERSQATDATLRLYRRLRERGFENLVLSLQARLRRTLDDIRELAPLEPRVSLCKGAYAAPPETVYASAEDVGVGFLQALELLLESASFLGIATSDRALVAAARKALAASGRACERYEFELLLGSTGGLDEDLLRAGEPLRIYVPYGLGWYDYTLRRYRRDRGQR